MERGESGTLHWQGYLEMPKACRFSKFKELKGAHFERRQGTPQQADEYCSKEDTRVEGPFRFGEISKGQGTRTDLLSLRDAVKSGKSGLELFDDDAVAGLAIKYQRGVDALVSAYHKPTGRDDITVIFHYGPPGLGKTHCACDDVENPYFFDGNNSGFWNGYKGEDTVILDEFGGHTLPPLALQRLCDRYPLWLNIKGGQIPCNVSFNPVCHHTPILFNNVRYNGCISVPTTSHPPGGVRRPSSTLTRSTVVFL